MSKSLHLLSRRQAPAGAAGIAKIRDIAANGYDKVNGVLVDTYSASAIVAVYDGLKPENQARLEAMPVWKLAEVCFRLINKVAA